MSETAIDPVLCPCCDTNAALRYNIRTDEYACGKCGLVSSVLDVKAHFRETQRAEEDRNLDAFANLVMGYVNDESIPF